MKSSELDRLVHVAASRLTLRVAAETHRLLGDFQTWLLKEVWGASREGIVDPVALWAKGDAITGQWAAVTAQWRVMVEAAQGEAALLPFAMLWLRHNQYAKVVQEAVNDPAALAQHWIDLQATIVRAAQARTHADSLNFSGRIWRLHGGGLRGMQDAIRLAFTERTSAADLSRRLEGFLGVNQDLPRWAWSRLYKMTPKQRAADPSGLLREPEMRSRGLSYKALRLARTEIQYANHAANDAIAAASPWVTGKYTRLSPAHPQIDICDDYASGGPYPVGDAILPLHPSCMCYYEYAVLSQAEFRRRADAWAMGSGGGEIDSYLRWAGLAGLEALSPLPGVSDATDVWLRGGADEHGRRLGVQAVEHPPVMESRQLRLRRAQLAG